MFIKLKLKMFGIICFNICCYMDDNKCVICWSEININGDYAMRNKHRKYEKYCIECIHTWLRKNKRCLISGKFMNSYYVYNNGECVEKVCVDNNVGNFNNNDYIIYGFVLVMVVALVTWSVLHNTNKNEKWNKYDWIIIGVIIIFIVCSYVF